MNGIPKKTRIRKSPQRNQKKNDFDAGQVAASISAGEKESSAYSMQSEGSSLLPVPVAPKFESSVVDEEGERLASRLREMNRDIAWLLVGAGVAGIILPGLIGTPFFIVGVLALMPGSTARIERWRKKNSSSTALNMAMKQINRFLDDLEKRYPRQLR